MNATVRLSTALVAFLALTAPALAASTTVKGKGDIKKLYVDNGRKALKAKVHGLGEPCATRFLNIKVSWGKKAVYEVQAGCYGGTEWAANLYYVGDPDSPETTTRKVACSRFDLRYVKGVYVARMPRKCLKKAADRVRVEAEAFYQSPIGGHAGPTKRLSRG